MSEVTKSPADDSNLPVESKSLTAEQFTARRTAQKVASQKAASDKSANQSKPEETKTVEEPTNKEGGPEASKESESKEVLSQKDLSELSDEDIAELAQKGKSGLLKRVAELTAKRKLAEERTAQLEQMLRAQQNQALPEPKVENNPFAKIVTAEELNAKAQSLTEVIDWAEQVIDGAEGVGPSEVVATVEGRNLTKAEVKQHLRDARKARDKFIPAQQRELAARVQRKQMREAYEANVRKEFDWASSAEDNDTRRSYQAMLSDPRLKPLEDAAPDVAAQLPYILAHAANSMYARKPISIDAPITAKVKPPSNPSVGAASAEQPENKGGKAVKELAKRFGEHGKVSDYVALRAEQISKRQSIKI